MKIMFSGGGTLGPVTPLLAVHEIYRRRNPGAKFVWVGTKRGPEKKILEKYNIVFYAVTSCKWRRYFSLRNIIDAIKFGVAFFQCLILLWIETPDLLVSAGGFVSVPLHWAGALLGIPAWVHQQDPSVGLANKLNARFAKKITTALRDTARFFPEKKTEWLGNPVRDLTVGDAQAARGRLGLPLTGPVIFALGGGTGASKLNELVLQSLASLPKDWQVIHLLGDRPMEMAERAAQTFTNYHPRQFFTHEMKDAYAAADVVIARAGFGTISELAALGKAAVIIPMPGSHQEENAKLLSANKAAIVLREETANGMKLAHIVDEIARYPEFKDYLGNRLRSILPPARPERVVEIIEELTESKK
ncbi:UDP-N-acetylglucosamine--N-acetylmuramyl-(pentapeptide) pyrophosphoryl-undecaprenol N-acetylglucosamine transferase [Patescibacteria group bacterium]|nr:MAG: UDP-N-acetylglucosamine--N-acetylmuramyl-(pentapeptide) pyrophosphoryl-undecaprenol N-acetylglucosamine transferase [Patescibacteria group bacterium]